jgi:hypothetical protein
VLEKSSTVLLLRFKVSFSRYARLMPEYSEHIVDMLRQMAEQKKLVAIHENNNDFESFVVGFVARVGNEDMLLRAYNPQGQEDGMHVIWLAHIQSLHWDSDYLRRIQYLIENPIELHSSLEKVNGDECMSGALSAARDGGAMITVHFHDAEKLSGLVSEIGEDWVEFEVILDTGQTDGYKLIPFYMIARLDIGGISEQVDLAVHRTRYGIT